MSTPQDPFAAPPGPSEGAAQPPAAPSEPQAPAAPAAPPAAPQWGAPQYTLPQQQPPAPPAAPLPPAGYAAPGTTGIAGAGAPYGGAPGYPQITSHFAQPPKTLALWTIILAWVAAVASALSAALIASDWTGYLEYSIDPSSTPSGTVLLGSLFSMLGTPAMIGTYVVLGLWWGRIRANRASVGQPVAGVGGVEWWGWFVPVANYVLPLLGMRKLTERLVGWGALLGWWIPFAGYWLLNGVMFVGVFGAVDINTGDILIDKALWLGPVFGFAAFLLIPSAAFLTVIVNKVTKTHLG